MTANYDSVLFMNDQNLIELMVTSRGRTQGTERFRARKERNLNWDIYANGVREVAMPIVAFSTLTVHDKLNDWKRCGKIKASKVKWRTHELSMMWRRFARLRKRFQRARRNNADDLAQRKAEFLVYFRTYKDELFRSEEDNWMRFIPDNKDDLGEKCTKCACIVGPVARQT